MDGQTPTLCFVVDWDHCFHKNQFGGEGRIRLVKRKALKIFLYFCIYFTYYYIDHSTTDFAIKPAVQFNLIIKVLWLSSIVNALSVGLFW